MMIRRPLRPCALALSLLLPAALPLHAQTTAGQTAVQTEPAAETALLPFPGGRSAAAAAARRISVTVDKGLTRTAALPTAALRQARRDMQAGKAIPDADLRALADHRDGLAAQALVRRLVAAGATDAATRSDIAFYGSIAVASGRVWTLPDTVRALRTLDPATEPKDRVKAHMAMLYPHAWAGNTLALDALVALNGPGRLFGPMSAKTRARLLDTERKAGGGRVALQLAIAALRDPADPAATATARACLEVAAASTDLGVATTAAALLARLDAGADPTADPGIAAGLAGATQ